MANLSSTTFAQRLLWRLQQNGLRDERARTKSRRSINHTVTPAHDPGAHRAARLRMTPRQSAHARRDRLAKRRRNSAKKDKEGRVGRDDQMCWRRDQRKLRRLDSISRKPTQTNPVRTKHGSSPSQSETRCRAGPISLSSSPKSRCATWIGGAKPSQPTPSRHDTLTPPCSQGHGVNGQNNIGPARAQPQHRPVCI